MSRPINAQTWQRLTTEQGRTTRYAAAGSYGRPWWPPAPVRGCRIVRAALVAARPSRITRTEYELQDFTPHPYVATPLRPSSPYGILSEAQHRAAVAFLYLHETRFAGT